MLRTLAVPALLLLLRMPALGDGSALFRNAAVVSARTPPGEVALTVTPVVPARDVAVFVLTNTLTADDLPQIQRSLFSSFTPIFLRTHTVRLMGSTVATATQLATVVKGMAAQSSSREPFSSLAALAPQLPSNWGRVIIIGRLPAAGPDSNYVNAALTDLYTRQRASVSFWSLDGGVPEWAQNLCAATAGLVATSDLSALLPWLDDTAAVFSEVRWTSKMDAGGWPSRIEFYNATNEGLASFTVLMAAPGFVPPIDEYLAARKKMLAAKPDDSSAAKEALALNAADVDALARLGLWQRLLAVVPDDANALGQLAAQDIAAAAYDDAAQVLEQAAKRGVSNRFTLEANTRLLVHRNQFADALTILDHLLATEKTDQSLWLLRADCGGALHQWPLTAESIEKAIALGPVPIERRTVLIGGYLTAGQKAKALQQLEAAIATLPRDAALQTQYAGLWDSAGDSAQAVKFWTTAIAIDAKSEAAYTGLGQHYLDHHELPRANETADAGLAANPSSMQLLLMKEAALEGLGDRYAARLLLRQRAGQTKQVELLKRWARMEDCCGSEGARAYLALVAAMTESKAAPSEINTACRRGLLVALRTEQMEAARTFAGQLSSHGDSSGLLLLDPGKAKVDAQVELLGGVEAMRFLILGNMKGSADSILLDYSRLLSSLTPTANAGASKEARALFSDKIHDYFRILGALSALGTRKTNHFEILLSFDNKPDKQRTEKVFSILGLKLKNGKEGVTLGSSEGKSQAKKQDTLAALAIDDQAIQEALASHKTYTLEIPVDSIPVFPKADKWQQSFSQQSNAPGGLFEVFLTDERAAPLYVGLNSMDREAADLLTTAVSLRYLAEHVWMPLFRYSAALALHGPAAEVPGGAAANAVWQQMTGVSPASPAAFFQALLSKDDGRFLGFFYTISQLDAAHQRFFTRSFDRTKRFYELYRDSPEMRAGARQLGSASFTTFIREVPLNDDGSVDFPGDPGVWMVAKGSSTSSGSVAKLTKKVKRAVAPDDEDQILIRLANTEYKTDERQHSELANFIAVARIDSERDHPLDQASALLLAQGFAQYQGLYRYFAELGDLETADYQKAFSLEAKLAGMDVLSVNHLLGEVHTFLALLGLLRENGAVRPDEVLKLYRDGLARYLDTTDAASRTVASLKTIDDLIRLNKAPSRDEAVRSLLLGDPVGQTSERAKIFQQVMALQKVPSLDTLFAIWLALPKVSGSPTTLDEIQRQLGSLQVVLPPKTWKLNGDRKKQLESFQTAEALNTVSKLRERIGKKKQNPADIEKLNMQLLGELEPWVRLAMVGQVYARFLDASDLVVSEDALLLRKHEFLDLGSSIAKRELFSESDMSISSEGEGSFFAGGLAAFSMAAGRARAQGNHLGGAAGGFLAGALFASVRATDWHAVNTNEVQSFGATVRLAREWIVESAMTPKMYNELERDTLGLLSLVRRKSLLAGVQQHDWPKVWQSVSISDLHFLADALLETAPPELWDSMALQSLKQGAAHSKELDALGSVAPQLSGCTQPRLRRYEPYEEYQRHFMPGLLAERLSELKMYLAVLVDDSAWPLDSMPLMASKLADSLASKEMMRDAWDWSGVIDSYRKLKAGDLEALLHQ